MKVNDIVNYPLPIVTELTQIQLGQAIACAYTAAPGVFGSFDNFGNTTKDLIEVPAAASAIDGAFFFICAGYTPAGHLKLIADRNIQSLSWETLQAAGLCTAAGLDLTVDDLSPHRSYRLLGSAEWDGILVAYDLAGAVTEPDSFYHTEGLPSWTLDTALTSPSSRIVRGGASIGAAAEIASSGNAGFRPVLLYNPKPRVTYRPAEETVCPLPLARELGKIEPGQAISCEYTAEAGKVGQFGNLGRAKKGLLPDSAPETPDGAFYFICVGYTPSGELKLVADRNIQGGISWETLNEAGFCTSYGKETQIGGIEGLRLRLLTTVSDRHVDENVHGEWDAILSYYDLDGKITASDNAVWNCLATKSWTTATLSTVDDAGTAADPSLRIARGGQDKDHFILRQSKYGSGSVQADVGFRPVLMISDAARFLYLKADGGCYTVTAAGDLEKMTDCWDALSETEKTALFAEKGSLTIAQTDTLAKLEKFKILMRTEKNKENVNLELRAVPRAQVLLPARFFPIEEFRRIHQMELAGIFSGMGTCKMAVTTDLKKYKTFQNGLWRELDVSDIADFAANGIDSGSIGGISDEAWRSLTAGKAGMGFAFLLAVESLSDREEADALTLRADIKGVWSK